MVSKAVEHQAKIKVNDEYGTPPLLFLEACKKYNISPKMDYAASEVNHVCEQYATKEHNSLEWSWFQEGYLNPPYSMVGKFMQKAYNEHKQNNITLLILVYAKTDTKWWHSYVENCPTCEVHFIKGRIRFLDNNGEPTQHPSPYPSVWIVYRGNIAKTQKMFPNFAKYGDRF